MFHTTIKSLPKEDICLLIKPDNHQWNYICECGDARELTVKEVQQTNAVFISHTHIDHFVNFDSIIRHQIGIERRVVICGPKGIAKQVQAKLMAYTWNLIKEGAITYEIREVEDAETVRIFELKPPQWELKEIGIINSQTIFTEKTFSVSFIILDHKTPTLAFKFKENDFVKINMADSHFKPGQWISKLKEAYTEEKKDQVIEIEGKNYRSEELFHLLHIKKGDSVGIIMDHAAHSENHRKIKEHFSDCETVFIESFFKEEDKERAELNYHSYSSMSGKIMRETGVKNAIPVHFSRKYLYEDIEELIKEFEFAFNLETKND